MEATLRGFVHKYGKNVDTDVIIPGKYCNIIDPVELGKHALEGLDPDYTAKMKAGDVIVADTNFGCGSSREVAPIAIKGSGTSAVIVKLTRTTLIVPLVLFYAWRRVREARDGERVDLRSIMPWFILWFLAAATLNSFGLIPAMLQEPLQQLALFAIVVALAGVGLGTDIAKIRSAGLRPLLLGAILWIAISFTSLGIASLAKLL